jgi:hypothetical protein
MRVSDMQVLFRKIKRGFEQRGKAIVLCGDCIVLCGGEASPARDRTQATEHVMMVGAWPCRLSSEVHVNG